MKGGGAALLALAAAAALVSCARDTSPLTAELDSRLETEGIVLRASNLVFRHSRGAGTVESSWEERRASIVVTAATVLIHDADRTLFELTPRTKRQVLVRRDRGRVRIRAGEGRNADTWSFAPPESAGAWVEAIRAVTAAPR